MSLSEINIKETLKEKLGGRFSHLRDLGCV